MVMTPGWVGLIALILTVTSENRLRGMTFWTVGDLGGADCYTGVLVVLMAAMAVVLPHACDLNALLTGEIHARAFGVPVVHVYTLIYVVMSPCTVVAVTITDSVAFVGLSVSHMVRLVWTHDVRIHLFATVTAGSGLLMLVDLIVRILIALVRLPVGAITTVLGVPTPSYLLMRSIRRAGCIVHIGPLHRMHSYTRM